MGGVDKMKQIVKELYQAPQTEAMLMESSSMICSSGEKVTSKVAKDYGITWDDDDD